MGLSQRLINATKPTTKPVFLWEDGFGCIIHPSGRRTYCIRYRLAGRDRRFVFGHDLSLEDARKVAAELRGQIARGKDPAELRREERAKHDEAPQTVAWLFEAYVKFQSSPAAKKPWRASTLAECERILKTDIKPSRLGKMPLRTVRPRDVRELHDGYALREKPAPYHANRVINWLSGAFNYAIREGLREPGTNPCTVIERFGEHERERAFTLREIEKIGEAAEAHRAMGGAAADAMDVLEVLALTGLRRENVLSLQWSSIDLEMREIVFAADTMKAGRTFRKAIGPDLAALLARRRAEAEKAAEQAEKEPSVYVFPARRGDGPLRDARKHLEAVFDVAKIEGATLHHVWRHTFASHAHELGIGEIVIGEMLGHGKRTVTSKYVQRVDELVRRAEERVQGRLAAALHRKPAAAVVPLAQSESTGA